MAKKTIIRTRKRPVSMIPVVANMKDVSDRFCEFRHFWWDRDDFVLSNEDLFPGEKVKDIDYRGILV